MLKRFSDSLQLLSQKGPNLLQRLIIGAGLGIIGASISGSYD